MLILNYYSHLILHSKYSFIIKLSIFLAIYMLLYADNLHDLAYCAKKKGAAKAAEAAKAVVSTKASAKAQLIAEAKEQALKSATNKFGRLLEEQDLIIQEKDTVIRQKDIALQYKEEALQNSYRRFFAQRDRADELEAQVAQLKEDLGYMREANNDLNEIYAVEEQNRKLRAEVNSLREELRVERRTTTNLRKELARTKRILQEDTYKDY